MRPLRLASIVFWALTVSGAVVSFTPVGLAQGNNTSATTTVSSTPESLPPQVRIGLRLTSFRQIVTNAPEGKRNVQHVAEEPLKHTLRARLNRVNHFYVGNYHIETRPLKWERESKRYEVQLIIARQFGKANEVEESVGTMVVSGILEVQPDGIYVLEGGAFKRFRDRFNAPTLDVAAGYRPAANGTANATKPAKAATQSSTGM